jgi:hypothetical protein
VLTESESPLGLFEMAPCLPRAQASARIPKENARRG